MNIDQMSDSMIHPLTILSIDFNTDMTESPSYFAVQKEYKVQAKD